MLERPGPLEARGGNWADEGQSDEFSDVTSLVMPLRLLTPQHIAHLVRDQEDARALDLVLVLLRRNLTMAHQAGAPGAESAHGASG